jgi:type I restriction enzyme S subunit
VSEGLPLGWTRARVEDLTSVVQYGSSAKTSEDERGIPVLRMGNIVDGRLDFRGMKYLPKDHDEFPGLLLEPGDVLFNRTNSPELVGKTAIYKPDDPSPCSFASYLIRLRLRVYEPSLFAAYMNSGFGRAWIRSCVIQQVGQANVSGGKLKALELPVPPLNEQRRIVAKLEALQSRSRRAREALDAVPPLLEKLRQSILAAAFRGDLTKDWRAKHKDVEPASKLLERIRVERRKKWEEGELAKMKAKGKAPTDDKWKAKYKEPAAVDATGLPELPEGWCWASVGELAHVGTGATPKRGEEKYYLGGNVSWVTSGALNDEEVTQATELVTDCAVAETNLTVYAPGTLLLAMYGEGKTRGMVAELRIDAATNQAIAAICLDGSAASTKSLVRLALERNYAEIRSLSMGGVQPNLNLEKVRGLAVPLCPPDEVCVLESAVRASLERASRVLDVVRAQGASLQTLNGGVLAKAFRGELVPQDPNDEPAEAMLERLRTSNTPTAPTRLTHRHLTHEARRDDR